MIEKRVHKDGSVRWKARIKSGGAVVAQQTFRLKGDAETWEREQTRALRLGTLLPPQKAKTPLGDVIVSFPAARTPPRSRRTLTALTSTTSPPFPQNSGRGLSARSARPTCSAS